jgi:hypothetical protein
MIIIILYSFLFSWAFYYDIETVQIFVSPLYRYNIQRPHITRFDCVCILFGIGQWREKKKSVNVYHTIFIKKNKRITVFFFFFILWLFVGRQQTRKFWEKSCADIVYYIIYRRLLSFVRAVIIALALWWAISALIDIWFIGSAIIFRHPSALNSLL